MQIHLETKTIHLMDDFLRMQKSEYLTNCELVVGCSTTELPTIAGLVDVIKNCFCGNSSNCDKSNVIKIILWKFHKISVEIKHFSPSF